MPLLRDALPFLASLLNLGWVLVLSLGASRRSYASVVLLHPSEHIAAPAPAKQLLRLALADRAANVEDDAASSLLQLARLSIRGPHVRKGLRHIDSNLLRVHPRWRLARRCRECAEKPVPEFSRTASRAMNPRAERALHRRDEVCMKPVLGHAESPALAGAAAEEK